MHTLEVFFTLGVVFLCANVEGARKVQQLHGTTKDFDTVLFKVSCGGSACIYRDIQLTGVGKKSDGKLFASLHAFSRSQDICIKHDADLSCNHGRDITLSHSEFFIRLTPKDAFTGGKLTVIIGNSQISVTELNQQGASVQKSPSTNKNYVRIKSGHEETKFPKLLQQYEVHCNGPCKNLQFEADSNDDVKLGLAEEEPVFVKDGGFYNSYCESNKGQGNLKKCIDSNNDDTFSLQSKRVFVTLLPDNRLKDVLAYVRGDNINSISLYNPVRYWGPYDAKDGKRVVVYFVKGPFSTRKTVDLTVFSAWRKKSKNIRIEILTDSTVHSVLAGKTISLDSSGNCQSCTCNDKSSCQQAFNPQLENFWGQNVFRVRVVLDPSSITYSAYVRIYGDDVGYASKGFCQDY